MKDILDQYEGLVIGSRLETSPPHREVIYYVNLIPGATFPNKVALMMRLAKNEEIER